MPPKFLCTDHVLRALGAQDKAQCAGGTGTLEAAWSALCPSLIWVAVPLSWLLNQDQLSG